MKKVKKIIDNGENVLTTLNIGNFMFRDLGTKGMIIGSNKSQIWMSNVDVECLYAWLKIKRGVSR